MCVCVWSGFCKLVQKILQCTFKVFQSLCAILLRCTSKTTLETENVCTFTSVEFKPDTMSFHFIKVAAPVSVLLLLHCSKAALA